MRQRILVLPAAAVLIAALCVYKVTRTYESAVESTPATQRVLSPRFELYDQNSQLVKFERYLGRHEIIVVFFDGKAGADRDRNLLRLRKAYPRLEARRVVVVGISTVLPQENRRAAERCGGIPFPLLSDIPQVGDYDVPAPPVHVIFQRYDVEAKRTLPGVCYIDRGGMLEWTPEGPRVFDAVEPVLRALFNQR
jgi:peroxiredoxin